MESRAKQPPQLFFSTAQQRLSLARQRFFDEGQRPTGLVSEAVIQSWARCMTSRRNPRERLAFEPVTPSRVHSSLYRSRELLGAATCPMAELEVALSGSACWALLIDVTGVVVHVGRRSVGGPEHLMPALGRVGVNVAEGVLGTNAPGLAAKFGQACTVLGGEHFFEVVQPLYCTAAPIRDEHGEVVAVLDISLEGQPFGFDAQSLVAQYAAVIENRLLLAKAKDQLVVHFHTSSALLGSPLAALAGVAADGRVVWTNDLAARWLGRTAGDVEPTFGLSASALLAAVGRTEPVLLRLGNGLIVWARVALHAQDANRDWVALGALPPTPPSAQVPMPTVPAAEPIPARDATLVAWSQQHIEKTLAACGGNVSSAARTLGVSRGLIYRHLRARTNPER